jgi:uncharacterized secreted protein with C-terminal beta-propeller domain
MVQKEVRRKTQIYATAAVLSAIVLVSMVYVFGTVPTILPISQLSQVSGMKTFSSTDELKSYLTTNAENNLSPPQEYWSRPNNLPVPAHVTFSATPTASGAYGVTADYSNTNTQVAGVDEADSVKTDGQYLYTISSPQNYDYYYGSSSQANAAVYILSADPQSAKVISKITFDNETSPSGLYLSPDSTRLVVVSSKYEPYQLYSTSTANMMIAPGVPIYNDVSTSVNVYDISNKASPTLTRNFTVSGSYFNSRMIGNYVYAVITQNAYIYNNGVTLPAVYQDSKVLVASPTSIYYADMNQSNSYSFTSFYGIDVADNQQQPTNMTVLMSGASTMYVSQSNIYVAYPNWTNGTDLTAIYRVKINGLQLSFEAKGSVPGNTINQYAMDEYNGNLRIATNQWQYGETSIAFGTQPGSQVNNVYVLNQDLSVVGKLEGLANSENLHSVRFMGDRCYLVTFQKTDPLFVIDLSQPQNPKVLGELVMPGYSDYLHPYDATHLIGIGKDAVSSEQGNFAWYQGLKLALFDVSNVNNPVLLSNFTIGDRGTDSPALNDPKAFLFDKTKNLLVIPVSLALVSDENKQQGNSAYGDTVWQGAYVFALTESGGFTLKGTITHLNSTMLNSQGQLNNTMDYYSTQNQWIARSLFIGNTLYTISNSEVKLNSLTDLSQIAQVNLQ